MHLALVLAAASLVVEPAAAQQPEPTVRGRPMSAWVDEAVREGLSGDSSRWDIQWELSPAATARWRSLVTHEDERVRAEAWSVRIRVEGCDAVDDAAADPAGRLAAATAFSLGQEGLQACAPRLLEWMRTSRPAWFEQTLERWSAAGLLVDGRFTPPSETRLSEWRRRAAAGSDEAVMLLQDFAGLAAPLVLRSRAQGTPLLRIECIVLAKQARRSQDAAAAFAGELSRGTCEPVPVGQAHAEPVAASLLGLLGDAGLPDPTRHAAATALHAIGLHEARVVAALIAVTREPAPATRSWAWRELGWWHADEEVLLAMANAACSAPGEEATAAALGLAELGSEARPAAPALRACLALDGERDAWDPPARALGLVLGEEALALRLRGPLGPEHEAAVRCILGAADHAFEGESRFVDDDGSVAHAVRDELHSADARRRQDAVAILSDLSGSRDAFVDAITKGLRHRDPGVAADARGLLLALAQDVAQWKLGWGAPTILALLRDETTRDAALELAAMRTTPRDAHTAGWLRDVLPRLEGAQRRHALLALARLADREAALSAAREALGSGDAELAQEMELLVASSGCFDEADAARLLAGRTQAEAWPDGGAAPCSSF